MPTQQRSSKGTNTRPSEHARKALWSPVCPARKAEVNAPNAKVLWWHQPHTSSGQHIPVKPSLFTPGSGEGDAHASCFQEVRLCLVVFIKMASVSYLNVNYCCDTRDNLTCFGNLFFPLIRCSNWKIFQSVTTVPKVKWRRRRGCLPQELSHNLEADA